MVVCCGLAVICVLAHLLCGNDFFRKFCLDFFLVFFFGFTYPSFLIRTCCSLLLLNRHCSKSVPSEALFAYVRSPCECVSVLDGVIHHFHEFIDREVVCSIPSPVVRNFYDELAVERVVAERSEIYIVVYIDAEVVSVLLRCVCLSGNFEFFGIFSKVC